jgi:hypothetical protein
MITNMSQGACAGARTTWPGAEARDEPRKGANPNRISSPVPSLQPRVSQDKPLQSAQVSEGPADKATEAGSIRRKRLVPAMCQAWRAFAAMTGDRLIRADAAVAAFTAVGLVAVAGHHARSRT